MTVRLTRTSHGGPPQLLGIEIDDGGHARSWQTLGHRVGRFARDLSAHERTALERALTSAREADAGAVPDPTGQVVRPSGATEQLVADEGPDLAFDAHEGPPPDFRKLIRLLLSLREDLVETPVAAIELAVDGPPFSAQLRHVGSEPVRVRMETLTVLATLFKRNSAIEDSKTYIVDASGVDGPVWPGWTLPLVDELGIDTPRKGRFLTVSVGTPEVDALGDGVLRSAEFSWMSE
jgi:hypothetical protein